MNPAHACLNDVQPVESSAATDFPMKDSDFRMIASILKEEAGIVLAPTKKQLVYSRLSKRLRALKMRTFSQYCAHLQSKKGAEERKQLLMALTTNVTHFFREPHHFETLKTEVLPPLIERAKAGGRVRLWSAGCSNGQEPYSIAMTLLELAPDAATYDIKILATDIDEGMIAHSKSGVYSDAIVKAVPEQLKTRYFTRNKDNNSWTISRGVQGLISFKPLNLLRPWPISGKFDVIFCRNVVIYFDEETQHPLWGRFASVLTPGGWIMIGHSERIKGPSEHLFESKGVTTYQLKTASHR